jgi:hypothetical protein
LNVVGIKERNYAAQTIQPELDIAFQDFIQIVNLIKL